MDCQYDTSSVPVFYCPIFHKKRADLPASEDQPKTIITMANVAETPAKTVEQQLEFLQHSFDSLFVCFGEAVDENKLLKRRIRQLERHITKLSLQLHQ